MYPVVRVIKELIINKRRPKLHPLDTHVSYHRCWPQDIDTYLEMNNGRILTIMDLGRTGLAQRVGLIDLLKRKRWGLTMAGVSVRYRKRIRPFAKFRVISKTAGWDHRFVYIDQSIWIGDECATQAMYRSALTSKDGIVPPDLAFAALGHEGVSPKLPDWIKNWIDADATRPWPPTDAST